MRDGAAFLSVVVLSSLMTIGTVEVMVQFPSAFKLTEQRRKYSRVSLYSIPRPSM